MLLTRLVDCIWLILNIFSIAYDTLGFTDSIKISKLFFNDLTDMLFWKYNLHVSYLPIVKIEVPGCWKIKVEM